MNPAADAKPATPVEPAPPSAASSAASLLTHVRRDKEIEPDVRPIDFKLYRRMFGYAAAYPAFLKPLLFCVVVRAIQLPLLNVVFSRIINGPIARGTVPTLLLASLGYLALTGLTQYIFFHRIKLAGLLGEGVVHDLRRDIFDHVQSLTMSFFHKTKLGGLISRVTSDSEVIRAGVQDAVFMSIVNIGQGLIALAIMSCYDGPLFLVVLATSPGFYLTYRYFRGRLTRAHRANQESFSRVTATLAESVTGIRITQGFARQGVNAALWGVLVRDHQRYNMRTIRAAGVFGPLLELLSAMVIAAIFIVGGYRVLNPAIGAKVEHIVIFYFMIGDVLGPVAVMSNNYAVAIQSMAGAERIFRLLDRRPDFTDAPDAIDLPEIVGRVEFRNLCFEYEPGKPVLRDVSFTAEPGQTVALVGHTGSGKTSIINLISKFYLPTSGELLIDGVDIRRVKSESLHQCTGIVLQQNFLFSGTVMDNIRMGRAGASDEQVIDAVRKLDCLDLVEAMAGGFQTRVGERGSGLSLGERQVVCFARAMLAEPRIMILDEATSSVDTLTEIRLQRALAILLRGRTSFVVAHRLSTIRHADLLLVLDHGRLIERGTHDMLLASGGVYSHLYRQFAEGGIEAPA